MLKKLLAICLTALCLTGCDKEGAPKSSAEVAPDTTLVAKLEKIATATKAAKSADDFAQIYMECGAIEIAAAAKKVNVVGQPAFIEACKVKPTQARAQIAISESTAVDMSVHCLTVSMDLADLVQEGVDAVAMKKLLVRVKTACRM